MVRLCRCVGEMFEFCQRAVEEGLQSLLMEFQCQGERVCARPEGWFTKINRVLRGKLWSISICKPLLPLFISLPQDKGLIITAENVLTEGGDVTGSVCPPKKSLAPKAS